MLASEAHRIQRLRWIQALFTLLDVCAAALNQKGKNGDKQNAGNNANYHDTIHIVSSFLNDSLP